MVQTGIKAPICFDGIPMKLKRIAHSIEHEELNGTYAFVCAIRSCKYWSQSFCPLFLLLSMGLNHRRSRSSVRYDPSSA